MIQLQREREREKERERELRGWVELIYGPHGPPSQARKTTGAI